MAEKTVYSLTDAGEERFERLMLEIAAKPIHIFLDFNAVIVNLDSLAPDKQRTCVAEIERNVKNLKAYLEENTARKENAPEIPAAGKAVLRQQLILAETIEKWIESVKDNLENR